MLCDRQARKGLSAKLNRLLAFETRAVVIEAGWTDLERGEWRSKVKPASVVSSVLGWIALGVPFVLAGDRSTARDYTRKLLFIARAPQVAFDARPSVCNARNGDGGMIAGEAPEILSRLEGVRETPTGWQARCPAHAAIGLQAWQ